MRTRGQQVALVSSFTGVLLLQAGPILGIFPALASGTLFIAIGMLAFHLDVKHMENPKTQLKGDGPHLDGRMQKPVVRQYLLNASVRDVLREWLKLRGWYPGHRNVEDEDVALVLAEGGLEDTACDTCDAVNWEVLPTQWEGLYYRKCLTCGETHEADEVVDVRDILSDEELSERHRG